MKSIEKKENLILFSNIAMLALTLFIMITAMTHEQDLGSEHRQYADFTSGWITDTGKTADLSNAGRYRWISKHLTEDDIPQDCTLYFNVSNLNIDVYVGDNCIYNTKIKQEGFYGKTPGSSFVELSMKKEWAGKIIYINIENPYSSSSGKIVNMYIGKGTDILRHSVSRLLGGFCFGIIMVFIGVMCIVIYLPMKKAGLIDREMLYLGIFSLNMGMCIITDDKTLQMLVGYESLYHMVSYMFMMLITAPLLLFFQKMYSNLNIKIVLSLGIASTLIFIVNVILNTLCIYDYSQTIFLPMLTFSSTIIYVLINGIKDFFKNRNAHIYHNIGIITAAVFVFLDTLNSVFKVMTDTTFFSKMGIMLLMCFEFIQIIWEHMKKYKESLKTQIVSRLAYHDGLTDMLNRTSFMEDLQTLEGRFNTEQDFTVMAAVFDVNNLKYVNDNFGHTIGDELIITAAKTISKYFNDMGKCYRTGGDEFVFISLDIEARSKFNEIYKNMSDELMLIDTSSKYPVSIACGIAVMNSSHKKVQDVIDEADANMYKNKRFMKQTMKLNEMSRTFAHQNS